MATGLMRRKLRKRHSEGEGRGGAMPPARPGGKQKDEVDEATGSTGRNDEVGNATGSTERMRNVLCSRNSVKGLHNLLIVRIHVPSVAMVVLSVMN